MEFKEVNRNDIGPLAKSINWTSDGRKYTLLDSGEEKTKGYLHLRSFVAVSGPIGCFMKVEVAICTTIQNLTKTLND